MSVLKDLNSWLTNLDLIHPGQMVSFLKDHEFRVLQLAGVTDPEAVVADTLGFLEIPFDRGLHSLNASQGSSALQIKIKIYSN